MSGPQAAPEMTTFYSILWEQTIHLINLSPNSFLFWLSDAFLLFIGLPSLWLLQQSLSTQRLSSPESCTRILMKISALPVWQYFTAIYSYRRYWWKKRMEAAPSTQSRPLSSRSCPLSGPCPRDTLPLRNTPLSGMPALRSPLFSGAHPCQGGRKSEWGLISRPILTHTFTQALTLYQHFARYFNSLNCSHTCTGYH